MCGLPAGRDFDLTYVGFGSIFVIVGRGSSASHVRFAPKATGGHGKAIRRFGPGAVNRESLDGVIAFDP
jgi:hypothetical protein